MSALDPTRGSEQAGTRPALVVQADAVTAILRTIVVVPFTSNVAWGRFPFCVVVAAGEGGLIANRQAAERRTSGCGAPNTFKNNARPAVPVWQRTSECYRGQEIPRSLDRYRNDGRGERRVECV
jgi:hypothetical protein